MVDRAQANRIRWQRELYRLGLLMTLFSLAVFLVVGTAWILLITEAGLC
jgi:hypothetical protein